MDEILADRYYTLCKTVIQEHIDHPELSDEIRDILIDVYSSVTSENAHNSYKQALLLLEYGLPRQDLLKIGGICLCLTGGISLLISYTVPIPSNDAKGVQFRNMCGFLLGVGILTLSSIIDQ